MKLFILFFSFFYFGNASALKERKFSSIIPVKYIFSASSEKIEANEYIFRGSDTLHSCSGQALNANRKFFRYGFPIETNESVHLNIGAVYLINNKDSMGYIISGILKKDSGNYHLAILCFDKALELDSTTAAVYLHRAYCKTQLFDYKSALRDYKTALTRNPTWEESYEAYFNMGLNQTSLKNLKAAMADFDYAIKLKPDYADAYYNRSIAKGRTGNYLGELEDITKVISLRPTDYRAYNSRGITKSLIGDFFGALKDYDKALDLNKKNSDVYFNRALLHYEMKEYVLSLADFNMVIDMSPEPDAEAYNRRGNVKRNLKDLNGAFTDYSAAIKIKSDYYVAYLNRGCLKFDMKDYQSAIDDFTFSIKLKDDYSATYYNRGLAKGKLDDYDGEIEDFTSAIEFKPDYGGAYYQRGKAKFEKGHKANGCEDLNMAVKLGITPAYDYLIVHCK